MRWLAIVTCCMACGAHVVGDPDDERGATPDGAVPADAPAVEVDGQVLPPDAPGFAALCAQAGYTAVAGLVSTYRTGAASDWPTARTACAADAPGATHLIVLSSLAEVDYMKMQRGWIGLSDRTTEGTFVNVTNEPADLRPFLSGQPDNGSGSEDCVQMKADGLDDDQCDNAHAFVCECDGAPDVP